MIEFGQWTKATNSGNVLQVFQKLDLHGQVIGTYKL